MAKNSDGTTAAVAVRRENMPAPVQTFEEIEKLGLLFERSGMFGCSQQGQGVMLAMTCMMTKQTPVEILETYHFINGRLSMRSDKMLARFLEAGGVYEILERTPERAAIKGSYKAATLEVSLSFEDAKLEPFVWGKDKNGTRELKDNYATPRKRMQMLWARVASDMVRAICPVVVSGVYTPEEVQDFSDDEKVSRAKLVVADVVPAMTAKPADAPEATTAKVSKPKAAKPEPKPEVVEPEVINPAQDDAVMPCGKLKGTKFTDLEDKVLKFIVATVAPSVDALKIAESAVADEKSSAETRQRSESVINMSKITEAHRKAAQAVLDGRAQS